MYYFYKDKGWVNKKNGTEENNFRVNFDKKIKFNNTLYNVCFFINPHHTDELNDKYYTLENLDILTKNKKPQSIYILYKTIELAKYKDTDYLRFKLDKFYLCAL